MLKPTITKIIMEKLKMVKLIVANPVMIKLIMVQLKISK